MDVRKSSSNHLLDRRQRRVFGEPFALSSILGPQGILNALVSYRSQFLQVRKQSASIRCTSGTGALSKRAQEAKFDLPRAKTDRLLVAAPGAHAISDLSVQHCER